MIAIDINLLTDALRDLQARGLVNPSNGRINWPEIIQVTEVCGLNNATLAKRIGKSRSTVHRLKHGCCEPESFEVGCRLIIISYQICKKI